MATTILNLHDRPLSTQSRTEARTVARLVGLLPLVLLLVFLILLVKAANMSNFELRPLVFTYSVFITTFVFSRLSAAVLWREHPATGDTETLMHYTPEVSIVIPCKNEEASIEETIRKSFAADYPPELLEVIIVNDGSTDRTIDVIRILAKEFPRLTVVDWSVNRGKRHAMAEGFRLARGEIVVQLDSDSYIVPETFRSLIAPFVDPRIGAVCAHADPTNAETNIISRMQAAYYFASFRLFKAGESFFNTVLCCSGCSSAYRKSVVLPLLEPWLNEMFLGKPVTWGDDRSLTSWVLRVGYETIYTFRARAYTIVPSTFRQLMKQQVRWKKSWVINSVFTGKFIWRQRPFVALTYFFPLIFVTLMTPLIALTVLFYLPVFYGTIPLYYAAGVLLVASLVMVFCRIMSRNSPYTFYLIPWAILHMCLLSYLLFYAIATIQNRGWGTR